MGWIDTIVVAIVVIAGMFILYKALKEPIDAVGGIIKKGFLSLKDSTSNAKDAVQGGTEVITYG